MSVADGLPWVENESQTKVGNAGCQIRFEQNVLGLEITMGDGGFAKVSFRCRHFVVEVSQSTSHALGNTDQFRPRQCITLRRIIERKLVMLTH